MPYDPRYEFKKTKNISFFQLKMTGYYTSLRNVKRNHFKFSLTNRQGCAQNYKNVCLLCEFTFEIISTVNEIITIISLIVILSLESNKTLLYYYFNLTTFI